MFIALITALYVVYVKAKEYVEDFKFTVIEEVKSYVQTEEFAKLLYQVGGLIGNGAKSGFGLQKRGGKMGLQDLIMGIAGNYLQQKIGVSIDTGEQPQAPQDNTNVTLKSKY